MLKFFPNYSYQMIKIIILAFKKSSISWVKGSSSGGKRFRKVLISLDFLRT